MSNQLLSVELAYRAMFKFLEGYCQRIDKAGDLPSVLSDIQVMADGRPADPAAWEDWLRAVNSVLEEPAQ